MTTGRPRSPRDGGQEDAALHGASACVGVVRGVWSRIVGGGFLTRVCLLGVLCVLLWWSRCPVFAAAGLWLGAGEQGECVRTLLDVWVGALDADSVS